MIPPNLNSPIHTWYHSLLLLAGLLCLAQTVGCSQNEVEKRRQETIENLRLSSEELEAYVRKRVSNTSAQSLERPELIFSRANVFPRDSSGHESSLSDATEVEIVFCWLQAQPSVSGCVVSSRKAGVECRLALNAEQLKTQEKEARRCVCFMQACRVRTDCPAGRELVRMLAAGDTRIVLTEQTGDQVGDSLRLLRKGDSLEEVVEGGKR